MDCHRSPWSASGRTPSVGWADGAQLSPDGRGELFGRSTCREYLSLPVHGPGLVRPLCRVFLLRRGLRRRELTSYLQADVVEEQLREVSRLGHRTVVTGTLHQTQVTGRQRPLQQLRAAAQVFR